MEVNTASEPGSTQQSTMPKSQPNAGLSWACLPFIVQQLILKELADDDDPHRDDLTQNRKHRSACAAVCLDWQDYFESVNFGKLVLHPSALAEFEKIIQRRQHRKHLQKEASSRWKKKQKLATQLTSTAATYTSRMPRIKDIWLRIELLEYDCPKCKIPEDGREIVRNNVLFTSAVWRLLDILSRWENSNTGPHQGLTLELSAHSPSDSRHMFRDDFGLRDDYPYLATTSVQREYIRQCQNISASGQHPPNDDFHSFNYPQLLIALFPMDPIRINIAQRLIRPLTFDFFGVRFRRGQSKHRLPEAKMVTSLLVRRQYYRELCGSALGRLLEESLTGLRDIRYERWRLPDAEYQEVLDWIYGPADEPPRVRRGILGSKLPPSLESLRIFEDFNEVLHGVEEANEPRPSSTRVLAALAASAPNIKHLSVSFLSDAMDCLDLPAARAFPQLESLALTSQHYLRPEGEGGPRLEDLLLRAARAAMRMPKLRIMELWNCAGGHAAVFRYESTGTARSSAARLTWRSSWQGPSGAGPSSPVVGDRVVRAWQHVAATNASRELVLEVDPLPAPGGEEGEGSYSRYGSVLHHLKLRDFVLDPVSGMQVRVGTREEGEPEVAAWKPVSRDSYC